MKLTLSIDGNLLREARKVALEMDTSVNSLMKEFPVDMNGRTWSRDELHERKGPKKQ